MRSQSKWIVTGIVSLTLTVLGLGAGPRLGVAQTGVAERVGEKLDSVGRGLVRGAQEVTDAVRSRFEVVRADVSRMGVQPRVYARIHWDKTLYNARIEVHMLRDGSVLLRGVVPDAAARARAVAIARDTVDVTGVVDELETVVATPAAATTTTVVPVVPAPVPTPVPVPSLSPPR
jgi:hyperosmotically inducible periplasmic protein